MRNPWRIVENYTTGKYEVHNEFGYWTAFNSYADASCWINDWLRKHNY